MSVCYDITLKTYWIDFQIYPGVVCSSIRPPATFDILQYFRIQDGEFKKWCAWLCWSLYSCILFMRIQNNFVFTKICINYTTDAIHVF